MDIVKNTEKPKIALPKLAFENGVLSVASLYREENGKPF